MNRDERYQDTRFEWVGEIPNHWNLRKLKHLVSYNADTLPENTDPNYQFNYIEIGDVDYIKGITINEKITFKESPSSARRVVKPKDVIVSTVRTYLRAIDVVPEIENVVCSTGFCVLRDRTGLLDQKFLSYSVKSEWFISRVISNSFGVTYPTINSSKLVEIEIVLPPLEEQKLISRYLDKKTEQIDSLIEKIKKKIELLKEQRTSLINQCVTKGLNPHVEMKDSGVEWISEIPSNWKLIRGRFLFNSKKEINQKLQCENLLSLTLFGVLNKEYKSSDGLRPENYNTYQIFQKDDLVFKMIDLENIKTSRVGLVHEEGIMSPVYLRHEPIKDKIDPKFSYWFYFDLYKKEIYNSIGSGVRSSLSSSDLLEITLPVPPLEEQKLISHYLDKKTEQIDSLSKKNHKKIELLREYRQSLISSVVTGKVRVKEDIV